VFIEKRLIERSFVLTTDISLPEGKIDIKKIEEERRDV